MIKTLIFIYFVVALIMAMFSLITVKRKLVGLGFWRMMLFFATQPILALRELMKNKRKIK